MLPRKFPWLPAQADSRPQHREVPGSPPGSQRFWLHCRDSRDPAGMDVEALLRAQGGVISRRQIREAGGDDNLIERMLRRRMWRPVFSGVYVDHTGVPTEEQRCLAAVLYAWPAALAGESGPGRSWPGPAEPVGSSVPADRAPRRRLGRLLGARAPLPDPGRASTRVAARATTGGIPDGHAEGFRDGHYTAQKLVVELDGRLGHEWAADQWADLERNLRSATEELQTVRLEWGAVAAPCRLAPLVGQVLRARGWDGSPHPCRRCAS